MAIADIARIIVKSRRCGITYAYYYAFQIILKCIYLHISYVIIISFKASYSSEFECGSSNNTIFINGYPIFLHYTHIVIRYKN